MPYKRTKVGPVPFVEHAGVTVYHVYKNNDLDSPRTYWFATSPEGSDEDAEVDTFDLRKLPGGDRDEQWWMSDAASRRVRAVIVAAIDAGLVVAP